MKKATAKAEPAPGISAIGVEGYKSLRKRTEIAIRPLTLLAGANSSGKSSVMQGPLLLKQTLEAPYDPGALLLDGPHVRFTSAKQLLSQSARKAVTRMLAITVKTSDGQMVTVRFEHQPGKGFDVTEMSAATSSNMRPVTVRRGMSDSEIRSAMRVPPQGKDAHHLRIIRQRCFLLAVSSTASLSLEYSLQHTQSDLIAIIHVPALRGNPVRTYKVTAVGNEFSGTFEPYVASIINHWQSTGDIRLKQLGSALEKLGLTWKVEATRVDDTQVELRVGRLRRNSRLRRSIRSSARDLVSIADVGFGLSQSLPVVVALLTARPGQLVYLEEPEIHLHPRAQVALAQILADAANRGVRVVAETHSALLLLGVQALVAEGKLSPDLVALHWFSQTANGESEVRSADLDDAGAFGDWPEDFDEVALDAQSRYLDAAEARLVKR